MHATDSLIMKTKTYPQISITLWAEVDPQRLDKKQIVNL